MDLKEFFKQVLSRKFAVALIGIIALCYIASISGGQVTVDEKSIVSIVPMPKVPGPGQQIEWLKLAAMMGVTLISCLTVFIQGKLDYFKLKNSKKDEYKFDEHDLPRIPPEDMPPVPPIKKSAEPEKH